MVKIREIRDTKKINVDDELPEKEIEQFMEEQKQNVKKDVIKNTSEKEFDDEYDDTIEKEFRMRLQNIEGKIDIIFQIISQRNQQPIPVIKKQKQEKQKGILNKLKNII